MLSPVKGVILVVRRLSRDEVLKKWKVYLETGTRYGYTTKRRYWHNVQQWLIWIGRRRKHWADATHEDCIDWWCSIQNSYSSSTLRQILTTLRNFYEWARDIGAFEGVNHWQRFQPPKVSQARRPTIPQDILYMLYHADIEPTWQNIRNRTMYMFVYGTTLRNFEAAKVRLSDINLATRMVYTIGKGGKERKQPMPSLLVEALEEWLELRKMRAVNTDRLWITRTGRPMSPQAFREGIKSFGRVAGEIIGRKNLPVLPHVLRKSALTDIYWHSKDLRATQEIAGHAKSDTTLIYVDAPDYRLAETIDLYHPMSSWARRFDRSELDEELADKGVYAYARY